MNKEKATENIEQNLGRVYCKILYYRNITVKG